MLSQFDGQYRWAENVRKLMNADRRLVRQNMVVEKTKQ